MNPIGEEGNVGVPPLPPSLWLFHDSILWGLWNHPKTLAVTLSSRCCLLSSFTRRSRPSPLPSSLPFTMSGNFGPGLIPKLLPAKNVRLSSLKTAAHFSPPQLWQSNSSYYEERERGESRSVRSLSLSLLCGSSQILR